MPVVPGTQVQISFYTFSTQYPPLYYGANEGTLNLASVNAGNSQGLYVGGGGVNLGFEGVLTASQKHVDDYQTRHQQLVAKAGVGGTASTAYPITDPCSFSYVNASQVSQTPGWYEGVCFVDVFDPKLAPHGNAKNMAMLYVAPPYGDNYASDASFLAAIQATAAQIIETVAGYNALAAAQNLPIIETLRNTLFSSAIYNRYNRTVNPPTSVPHAAIAGAILAGFAAGLRNHPQCGLKELQFPVGSGAEPLFASLQTALAGGPTPVMVLPKIEPAEESDDPDADAGDDGTELTEMSSSDDQGAPPAQVVVDNAPMTQAASAIDAATDSLLQMLNGQPALQGNANYGVIPQFKSVGYELPGDPFGDAPHYQPMSPDILARVNAPTFNDPILDANVVLEFKKADKAFSSASKNYEAAKHIKKDLPALRTARDTARQHEQDADAAATAAENAAKASGFEGDKQLAKRARDAAYDATVFSRALDTAVKKAESALNCFQDANGKVILGRVIGAVVGGTLTTLGGALLWAFVFGGGRKVLGSGVLRFGIKPITKDMPDTLTTVDIDVLKENGDLVLVAAVHLHDDQGQQVDTFGGFTAKDNHITYQVPTPKVASASVDYVLQAVGAPGAVTDPAKLTLNFTPVAVDVIEKAGRTTMVSFAVPAGATLVGSPMEQLGWVVNSTTVTYTPVAPEGPTRELTYQVTNGTQAKLIALFPAIDLKPVDGSRSADTAIDLPAGSEPVKLLDAQNAQQTTVAVAEGSWTVAGSKITFTPNPSLPPAMTSLSVSYVVVRGDKASTPGTATVNFAAVGPVATTKDLTFVTADRTKAFVFAVQGATLTVTTPAGDGTWSSTDPAKVTFQPATTLAATEVTVSAAYKTATEQGTLSLTYLPVPAPIAQSGVARILTQTIKPTLVDVTKVNAIQANYAVKLWNGSAAVDRVNVTDVNNVAAGAAEWTLIGKSIIFTPRAKPFKNNQATMQYVLSAADGTVTAPATVTLTLSDDPVAYDATYVNVQSGTFEIDFLSRCFIASPAQFASATFTVVQPSSGVTATLISNPGPKLQVVIDSAIRGGEVKVVYSVTDSQGRQSNTDVFTMILTRRFMPAAADYLLSQSVLSGQAVGADVLSGCSTFFGTDPKSVHFTGLKDIGQGNQANQALLAKDGKSLRVPGEGTWVVGDHGLIGFTAEPHLSVPPTPVAFRFADVKGNLSNEATVVIDPGMAALAAFPANLAAMDDATFWKNFQLHVSRAQPPLADEVFLTATSTLAGALLAGKGAKGGVGLNPVAPADFEKTLQAWIDGGQGWDDPVGTAQPTGLVALCAALVDPLTANSKLALRGRYWRLELMARMVAATLDDSN